MALESILAILSFFVGIKIFALYALNFCLKAALNNFVAKICKIFSSQQVKTFKKT